MTVRTTLYIDEELMARVRRLVPPRGLNRFISESLAEKVDRLERERLQAAMKDGYLATGYDRSELDEDWQVVETEGWPE